MLYTQNNWNANATVGLQYECYGAQVSWSNMTCLTQNYSYDNLNRLTSVVDTSGTGTNYSRTFQFDEFGNMSLAVNNYVPQNGFTPVGSPSITPFNTANNQIAANTYDARGNATQLTGSGVHPINVTYDGENRQTQTVDTNSGGLTVNFAYDALGQRVQQVVNGTTTVYVHDALGQLAAEYNSGSVTPACTTCYLSYDQLGSVRLITDQGGNIVARHDYLPFGEEIPGGKAGRPAGAGFGAGSNVTQMFTGQERDGGNAVMDYFNARHMSAALERFMQPDPGNAGADILNPQSWNGYAYVLGNPLGLVDPSGMYAEANTTDNDDDGFYQCCNFFFFPVNIVSRGGGGGKPSPPSGPSMKVAPPAKNGKTCPAVPLAPSNANLDANLTDASSRNPVNGGVNPQSGSYVNPASTLSWFNNQVKYGGPWDYKVQGSQYEDFGNFNYGATGTAAGFDAGTLLRAAGYAQRHHPETQQFPGDPGNPASILLNSKGGKSPFGDNPQNQQVILLGIQYAKNGC